MATIQENKYLWNDKYAWRKGGEEWSDRWGTSEVQWYGTLFPRIHTFLPVATILEIAPGFGRWTRFLKDLCQKLLLVDLSEKCIQTCRERFSSCTHISYFNNDGKSLDMIPDGAVDFLFSFDSLVHAEDSTMAAYIAQLPRILSPNGVAFIHHSNLAEYTHCVSLQETLSKIPNLVGALIKLGVLDNVKIQMRDPSMSAVKMEQYARESDLKCITQELVTWGTKRALIDCMSTLTKKGSIWARENQVLKNPLFMQEAANLLMLSHYYDLHSENNISEPQSASSIAWPSVYLRRLRNY